MKYKFKDMIIEVENDPDLPKMVKATIPGRDGAARFHKDFWELLASPVKETISSKTKKQKKNS